MYDVPTVFDFDFGGYATLKITYNHACEEALPTLPCFVLHPPSHKSRACTLFNFKDINRIKRADAFAYSPP